jgi:hypothetical protein
MNNTAEFERSGQRLLQYMKQFKKTLSRRDMRMIRIGMRASHIEEALSTGDTERANSHLKQMIKDLKHV